MSIDFHHLYIFTESGAPIVDQMIAKGFAEGTSNTHAGQGTSNRRIFFHNGMLEFIWVSDLSEVRSEVIARTKLYERSIWPESGYSPFGICVFSPNLSQGAEEFEGWDYRPSYLPKGFSIWMARQDNPIEPGIFHLAGPQPILAAPINQPASHANGARRIKRITIHVPERRWQQSEAMGKIAKLDIIKFNSGSKAEAVIEIESDLTKGAMDFSPSCPVRLALV